MAISKKKLRSIVVNGQKFYWKFDGKIFVYCEALKNSPLIVDIGWFDVWLDVGAKANEIDNVQPKSVTPKFVSESILFALKKGWKQGEMEILFKEGEYEKISKSYRLHKFL